MRMMQEYMKLRFFIYLLLQIFLLIPINEASAKIYLVSAGIADYPGTANDLTLPAKDAQVVTRLYAKNGNVEYVELLNDRATLAGIVNAANRLFSKAGPNDIVVLFFSGHGSAAGFIAYDGLLSYAQIRKIMSACQSRCKMIFADACFSGKLGTSAPQRSSGTLSSMKNANVMLFMSSRSNELSIERPDMQNGFFTTYLHRGLSGYADKNKDRIITAKELYAYVHSNVVKLSGGRQHPVMWGRFPDNMTVMRW